MDTNKNGKAGIVLAPEKKNGNIAPLNSSNVKENKETPVIKLPEELKQPKIESVEERIFKVANIQTHITNRAKIRSHLEKINALKFGELDEKDNIVIVPAVGEQYQIKSSPLCKLLKETMANYLGERLIETEAQIVF